MTFKKALRIVQQLSEVIAFLGAAIIFITAGFISGWLQIYWPSWALYEEAVIFLLAMAAVLQMLHIKKISYNLIGLIGGMAFIYAGIAIMVSTVNIRGVWIIFTLLAVLAIFINLLYHAHDSEMKHRHTLKS